MKSLDSLILTLVFYNSLLPFNFYASLNDIAYPTSYALAILISKLAVNMLIIKEFEDKHKNSSCRSFVWV
ncbi:hypothetical protein CEN39_25090 [Fischerella thermalis CCMEE 5201]|nr:hypothetical protein CEN39_25090 [Fischerella thermalis CCMEE 5201]